MHIEQYLAYSKYYMVLVIAATIITIYYYLLLLLLLLCCSGTKHSTFNTVVTWITVQAFSSQVSYSFYP